MNSYKKAVEKVAQEMNLPYDKVDAIYKQYWKVIKEIIEDRDFRNVYTQEEFDELSVVFSIKSLGTLTSSYNKVMEYHRNIEYKKQKYAKNKKVDSDVHSDSDNNG